MFYFLPYIRYIMADKSKAISKKYRTRTRTRKCKQRTDDVPLSFQGYYRTRNFVKGIQARKRIETEEERIAREVAKSIIETILTLRCPNKSCQTAFVDFDGCFALLCHQCGIHFCAWCIAFTDWHQQRIHIHVGNCDAAMMRGTQHSFDVFLKHQRVRRRQLVIDRLRREKRNTAERVLDIIDTNLRDLDIEISAGDVISPEE